MDQKLSKTMVNGNLLCKDLTAESIQSESGFTVKTETKFRDLEVLETNSEDIKVGDVLKVPYHSVQPIDQYFIVNRQSIIAINYDKN